MLLTKRFSEDTADPITVLVGTPGRPQDLTGATAEIVLRELPSGARIQDGVTTIDDPATQGLVRRPWLPNELVPGRRYAVECVVTLQNATTRTYPGPNEPALVVEIVARRT